MTRATWITGCCLLAACATSRWADPPALSMSVPGGIVRADEQRALEVIAETVSEMLPAVQAVLGEEAVPEFEVWLLSEPAPSGEARGYTDGRRIVIHADALRGKRFVISHELAHCAVKGTCLERLPAFLQEGLCAYVSVRAAPETRNTQEGLASVFLPLTAAELDEVVRVPEGRRWRELPYELKVGATYLGWKLTEAAGLDFLKQVASDADRVFASGDAFRAELGRRGISLGNTVVDDFDGWLEGE